MLQLIIMIQQPSIAEAPLEPGDAIGAFHDGVSVGYGFQDGDFVTVAAMNVPHDGLVTFSLYDASTQAEAPMSITVTAPPETEGYKNRFIFVGCTDEGAINYIAEATTDGGNCIY
jgi:hypothetical protein